VPRAPRKSVVSPEQWKILLSPVRAEVAEALRLLGPSSIADIADVLDRPADALYPHVRTLIRAGFVTPAGTRKLGRHVEALYDVVADDFLIDFSDNTGKAENDAIVATGLSLMGAMSRTLRDAADARALEFPPDRRNISMNYELAWLTPEDFRAVRELIARIKAVMDAGKARRAGRLYMTLAMAVPVVRSRGAHPKQDPPPPDGEAPRKPRRRSGGDKPPSRRSAVD
jgi:predicted transcriptional regulator